MSYKFRQGFFRPKNPSKYIGNVKNIVYRSSLEFKFMMWLDNTSEVIKWGSEELVIPYVSPVDNKVHRYFTDNIIQIKKSDKLIETIVIEIKPESQTKAPVKTEKKKQKTFLKEAVTYAVNTAKWEAAENFCKKHGWKFQVITEKDLK